MFASVAIAIATPRGAAAEAQDTPTDAGAAVPADAAAATTGTGAATTATAAATTATAPQPPAPTASASTPGGTPGGSAASAPPRPTAPPAVVPPAPVDIAAFPPRAPAKPDVRPPGVEVHGFTALWWTPWSQEGPGAATEALRLRFAVLRIDARPAPKVTVLARLGLMLPGSPLLDLAATYQGTDALGLTFGQFRLPLGAAATTLAPQLVMLDRPRYVYAMTKLAFRDVGAMVHSGPAGVLDGVLHYRLAVASGSGRLGSGLVRPPEATAYLVAGRVLADVGRSLGGARDRLVVGLSSARSRDPAIDTGSIAADRGLAVNTLGRTLVPFGETRVTHLAGADLTLARGPLWLQAETMYLRSRTTAGDAEASALGVSLEAAYTLPTLPSSWPVELQLAVRGEHFDPDRDLDADAMDVGALGLNATTARMRWSAFYGVTRFEDALTGDTRHAGELAVRAQATF